MSTRTARSIPALLWDRPDPMPWPLRLKWSLIGALALSVLILDVWGLATTLPHLSEAGRIGDWVRMAGVDPSAPYANNFYRWAPPAIWIWDMVVEQLGFWVIFALHLAVLAFVRPWWLALAVAVSWPFWSDAVNGSTLTFVAVTAYLALRGNRPATIVFLVLCALMPRPLMLPALATLLWRQPWTRWWAVAVGAAILAWSAAGGHLFEWVFRLANTGNVEINSTYNFGPSAWIGAWWIPLGVALATWLTWRGRVGLASLAASPYWFGYYLLMLLLEMGRPRSS